MQNEMNNFYSNHQSSSDEKPNFDVGFICAIFCQNSWYRAEVVDVESYPAIVVSLLETGFTLYVDVSMIRRLPDLLSRIPTTILRCSLSGLFPPCGMGCWDESTIDFIKRRLQSAEWITIEWKMDVTFSAEKVLPVTVYIYNGMQDSSQVDISLNAELIQLGLAITTGYSLPLFKSSWNSLEFPKIGETFTARATWFNEKGKIFLQDVRYKPELDYIREYLHEKYENTRSTESDLIFSPGDLCIVKLLHDWFRCTIIAIRGKEIEVYFADFGIVDVVDISDIRLDIALEEKSVQVVRCSLWNQPKLSACCNTSIWCAAVDHNVIFQEEAVEGELSVKAAGSPLQVELLYKSD